MILHNLPDVSRETFDKLRAFSTLVEKWTRSINLVSQATVPDLWKRHILDSAQLARLAPGADHWVDIGSGGGFPAVVIAILGEESGLPRTLTLIESDIRKCAFLRTAIRELDLRAQVIAERSETTVPQDADVLSARAMAGLDHLLSHADRHLNRAGTALFPKGGRWRDEVAAARRQWSFTCESVPSRTNPDAAILRIKDIARV